MPYSPVAPSPKALRLEQSAHVVLLATVLGKLALSLEGRPSLVLSLLVLTESVGGLFYYWRLRPRLAAKSAVAPAGKLPISSVHGFSKERVRFVACMFVAALAGGGGLTALGFGNLVVGLGLVVVCGGLLAITWCVPWPFE